MKLPLLLSASCVFSCVQSFSPGTISVHGRRRCTSQLPSSNKSHEYQDETITYPVQIRHQGHTATIHVQQNEPILHALERQASSTTSSCNEEINALGLSSIPHECRRGNCLTCTSRLLSTNNDNNTSNNIQPNVNTGLTPAMDRELNKSSFVLTCCSYITGPGVILELEQNEAIWDEVYRARFDNMDRLGAEMVALQQRRVDEKNVGRWRERMEKLFGDDSDWIYWYITVCAERLISKDVRTTCCIALSTIHFAIVTVTFTLLRFRYEQSKSLLKRKLRLLPFSL